MGTNLDDGIYKTAPEDFVVQELIGNPPVAVKLSSKTRMQGWDGHSTLTMFEMSKRGWETQNAMKEVARQLGVSSGDISRHGTKDKQACTSQFVGVHGRFRGGFDHRDISLVQLPGQDLSWVQLDDFGRLRRGGNYGNRFNIFVHSLATKLNLAAVSVPFPNLYGTQRTGEPGTENIGRLFLEGQPEQAIELLRTTPGKDVFLEAQELAGGSWEAALDHPAFQENFGYEVVKWQAFLWNKLCQEKFHQLGRKIPDKLPMWNLNDYVYDMYRHLWNPAHLDDRVLEKIAISPRITTFKPEKFQYDREAFGWRFFFDLRSGQFATVVLSQLFELDEYHC